MTTIYLDTSIVCCLTDPPSSNSITRACQQLTQLWWHTRCVRSQTHVSEYVLQEIRDGDPLRATRRISEVRYLNQFPATDKLIGTSELLVWGGGLSASMLTQIAEYESPELVAPFELMESNYEDL
jgi:hypothetical protein